MKNSSWRFWMLVTAVLVLALDFYTKYLAIAYLAPRDPVPFGRYVEVIPGFFNLSWAENTGGAFSFMHTQPWVILSMAALMIVGITIWAFRMPQRQRIVQFAFGLIIGGAIGNLLDRLRFGYVVDFLDFYYVSDGERHTWPTFNVADIAIVVGIGLFMVLTAFTKIFDAPPREAAGENPQLTKAEPSQSPDS